MQVPMNRYWTRFAPWCRISCQGSKVWANRKRNCGDQSSRHSCRDESTASQFCHCPPPQTDAANPVLLAFQIVANVVIMDNSLALMARFLHQNGNGYWVREPSQNFFSLPPSQFTTDHGHFLSDWAHKWHWTPPQGFTESIKSVVVKPCAIADKPNDTAILVLAILSDAQRKALM